MSWFPWKTASFLLLISTAAIISADVERAGGRLNNSNIGLFLKVFDSLCPVESTRTRKRLCVVLFTTEAQEMEQHRQAMRDWLVSHKFSLERVRFTYMLVERQKQFVSALTQSEEEVVDPLQRVVVLWRRGEGQVKLEWLQNKWDASNTSGQELEDTLTRLLSSTEVLTGEAVLDNIMDEHAVSMFSRMANRMIEISETLYDRVTLFSQVSSALVFS